MNDQLSWLESIIIRRNLLQLQEQHTSSDIGDSPYTSSLQDYWSAAGTLSDGGRSRFNPFDSPPPDLSDLPPLPHSHSNSPLSPEVISQQQQLIDILSVNIDPTLYPEPASPQEAVFEDLAFLQQDMGGWTEQPQTSLLDQPNPKRWVEPTESVYTSPPAQDTPVCRAYLSGTCRNGASCVYRHKLPMDHERSSRYPPHLSQHRRSDSERGSMSSSSGTPSDAYPSPAQSRPTTQGGDNGRSSTKQDSQGWITSSGSRQPYGSTQNPGFSSGSAPQPPPVKPQTDFAWTAPPTQPNDHQNNYSGRPLSPDGWPTKKQEIRGHEEPVPDLLAQYLDKQSSSSTAAHSTGWKTTSSNVSGNTVTAAREIPLPSSEIGNAGWSRPSRPTPSPPPLSAPIQPTVIAQVAHHQQQRAQSRKAVSPAPFSPIAPDPVAPAAIKSPTTSQAPTQQQQVQVPTSQVSAPVNETTRPQSQAGIRIVSGWTVKVPFRHDEEVPPVPAIVQEYNQPSAVEPLKQATSPITKPLQTSHEAWVLPSVDAVKNNNWTSTIRRSRVSREEQGPPTYTHASSYGHEEGFSTAPSGYDDNSIRPSESASNVGFADDSMASPIGSTSHRSEVGTQSAQSSFRYKTMRKFESEKDSDLGSEGSSGSLNDNPNIRAGGWQRPAPVAQPAQDSKMTRQSSRQSEAPVQPRNSVGHPSQYQHAQESGSNGWNMPQAQTSGWIQQPSNGESRGTPLTAPTPRRWDSASQQLVGDLERAATPRAAFTTQTGPGHGRSVSTATRGAGSTMSIRGASKYHAESVMLREELDKIRAQVAKYENVLASMDASESNDAELEKEIDYLRSENSYLRNKVEKLEAEREQMKNALQPLWRLLDPASSGKQQNSGSHAVRTMNGS